MHRNLPQAHKTYPAMEIASAQPAPILRAGRQRLTDPSHAMPLMSETGTTVGGLSFMEHQACPAQSTIATRTHSGRRVNSFRRLIHARRSISMLSRARPLRCLRGKNCQLQRVVLTIYNRGEYHDCRYQTEEAWFYHCFRNRRICCNDSSQ